MRGKIKELPFIIKRICLSLLETINKAKYSIYEKLSTVLSVEGTQFSAALKALVLGKFIQAF